MAWAALTEKRFVVALTGGIAAGKSAVQRRFETWGIHAYDADQAARAIVAPGSDGLAAVVATFGTGILDTQGRLDRTALRRRIFTHMTERRQLEKILHPRIRARLIQQMAADRGPYCLLAIPLLAENIDDYRWVDRILVVDVPRSVQFVRLIQRDHLDPVLATHILNQQASRNERLALADDVIDNTDAEEALDAQVRMLHQRYLALAAEQ